MVTSYLKMKGETMLRTVQCINMHLIFWGVEKLWLTKAAISFLISEMLFKFDRKVTVF